MQLLKKYLSVALMLFCSSSWAEEFDLNYYQQIFEHGSRVEQTAAASTLEWSGLSDEALFDVVAANLEQAAPEAKSKASIDHVAWLLKALAFSGNEKYRAEIQKYTQSGFHKKVRKYAKKSLGYLDQHKLWNPIINDADGFKQGESLQDNRLANMIRSDVLELNRIGAKRVHYEHNYTPYLLETLAAELKAKAPTMADDKLTVDAYAWMAKAVAGSGEPQYRPLIEQLSKEAGASKMRKYARKYLNYF
ncbi:hypothetical protein [Ferrimonas futtsuensis]|uniref:hypothetical protein n=1 Tax=Ferrimonas futtsuensis TaxID=364764 RepID=UPI00041738D0|nr:hypothetical protein [Ferrimonas futtsuensis]